MTWQQRTHLDANPDLPTWTQRPGNAYCGTPGHQTVTTNPDHVTCKKCRTLIERTR